MGGWSLSGFRVYLGQTIGDEKREQIIYANGEVSSSTAQTRTVTQSRAVIRGLTQAGALAYVATNGWTIVSRERVNEAGEWNVIEEQITYGEWGDDA